jgi:nitronate monooxygenase
MSTIRELLGTDLPIIQAPMAGVQASALAIAVSSAGGLGSLPCAMLSIEQMRAELTALGTLAKPYNVNFFCHTMPAPDVERDVRWRRRLATYYDEFGIDIESIRDVPGRQAFSEDEADVLAEFKPPVVSFHFGLPSAMLLARVKSWGAKVISSATTVGEARWLENAGVDAIVAQGVEAGGHRGMFLTDDLTTQSGTLALVPQMTRAVSVPVIAAGGIVDAQTVKAALALGAAAVQIGTAFMLCDEAQTSAVHRSALASDRAAHTALTNVFTGRPARGIVNRLIREVGPISPEAPAFPLALSAVLPLRAAAESRGSGDFSPLWAGQNATGCRQVDAGRLTRALAGI